MTGYGSPPAKKSSAPGSIPAPRFDPDGPLTLSLSPSDGERGRTAKPAPHSPSPRLRGEGRGEGQLKRSEMIELNGRQYRLPARPVAVICADGCDPAYLEAGFAAGVLPTIAKWRDDGFYGLADAVMPTFTNPNNM